MIAPCILHEPKRYTEDGLHKRMDPDRAQILKTNFHKEGGNIGNYMIFLPLIITFSRFIFVIRLYIIIIKLLFEY